MYNKEFIKIVHQHRIKLDQVYERKILLCASFPLASKKKSGEHYYILYLQDIETGQCVTAFCGAKIVVEALDAINHLTLEKPTIVEFYNDSIDGGPKFINIFFHEIDMLAQKLADAAILATEEKL